MIINPMQGAPLQSTGYFPLGNALQNPNLQPVNMSQAYAHNPALAAKPGGVPSGVNFSQAPSSLPTIQMPGAGGAGVAPNQFQTQNPMPMTQRPQLDRQVMLARRMRQ